MIKPIGLFLPGVPPTTNHMYINTKHGRVLAPEYKRWKEAIVLLASAQLRNQRSDLVSMEGKRLAAFITIRSPSWLNKNGTIKKSDVCNREKALMDAIFEAAGQYAKLDDSQIFWVSIGKGVCEKLSDERTFVTISVREYT